MRTTRSHLIHRLHLVQVVVAEGAPKLEGLTMARHLTDTGIPTLVIPDACTFALMARVNKVLVGAQAVLATGGIIAQSGSRLVALAAKHHRVPFVVVTGVTAAFFVCVSRLLPSRLWFRSSTLRLHRTTILHNCGRWQLCKWICTLDFSPSKQIQRMRNHRPAAII
jgi:hypothetical protein